MSDRTSLLLKISPYVWKENQALLRKEISCIKELEKDLAVWSPPERVWAEVCLGSMESFLKDLVRDRGYPNGFCF